MVDSYRTDMAAYETDLRQCVNIAQRAEAEYERKSREQRDARAVTGLLVGAVIGAVIGRPTAMPATGRSSAGRSGFSKARSPTANTTRTRARG